MSKQGYRFDGDSWYVMSDLKIYSSYCSCHHSGSFAVADIRLYRNKPTTAVAADYFVISIRRISHDDDDDDEQEEDKEEGSSHSLR